MRKIIIALLMAAIAISLSISSVHGVETGINDLTGPRMVNWVGTNIITPHPSAVSTYSAMGHSFRITYTNVTLSFIEILCYKIGNPSAYFGVAIYNATGTYNSNALPATLLETSTTQLQISSIGAAAVYSNFTFANTTLLTADTVYFAVIYEINETTCDASNTLAVGAQDGVIPYDGDIAYFNNNAWTRIANYAGCINVYGYGDGSRVQYVGGNSYYFDTVLTYDLADIAVTTSVAPVDVMFVTLLLLIFLCIFLMLKSGIPILNFVFGVITLGISAYSLQNPTIVFFGYIQMAAILMASLCMLSGYRSFRNE